MPTATAYANASPVGARFIGTNSDNHTSNFAFNDMAVPITPQMYDAAGSGSDDTMPFANTLAAGGAIRVGEGTWKADLALADGIVVHGAGRTKTIIEPYTSSFVVPVANRQNIVFRDLTFRNFGGFQFSGSNAHITFENCIFDGGVYPLGVVTSTTSIACDASVTIDDITIRGCEFKNLTGAAIRLGCVLSNAWIENNHIHDVESAAWISGGIFVGLDGAGTSEQFAAVRNIFITGNTIEDCNNTVKTGDSSPGNSFNLNAIMAFGGHVHIEGNSIRNVQGVQYDNEAIYTKAHLAVVIGNTLEDSGATEGAIDCKGEPSTDPVGSRVICTNNVIRFTTLTADGQSLTRTGILLHSENSICAGNIVSGANGDGITVHGAAGNYHDVIVFGNSIQGHLGLTGIDLLGGYDRLTVNDNIIGWGTIAPSSGAYTGIYLNPQTSQPLGTRLRDLDISGNIVDGVSNVTLSGSATLSPIRIVPAMPINSLRISGGILATTSTNTIIFGAGTEVISDLEIIDISMPNSAYIAFNANNVIQGMRVRQKLKKTTTDNTTPNIFSVPVAEGSVVALRTRTVAAAIVGTDAALYEKAALFTRYSSSAPVQVGSTTSLVSIEDVAGAWSQSFDVSTAGGANNVRVLINGDTDETVNWTVDLDYRASI